MEINDVKIEAGWKEVLKEEFEKDYFPKIKRRIIDDKESGLTIYPPGKLIFNAFNLTAFDKVKVVIIGQDPYHGSGQAMGLCFSVPRNIARPASLLNIYKELNRDLQIPIVAHGDLTKWAQQGVLLLNAVLTVVSKSPGSHSKIGWETFTDAVISRISELNQGVVFMLWGNYAKNKKSLVDETKHFVLESAHPSPLAGNRFYGNGHFSACNQILIKQGKEAIDWSLE